MGIGSYKKPKSNNEVSTGHETICSAEKFYIQAEKLKRKSKYKESIENYLNSILIDRNNPNYYIGIANAYKNLKNYDKALFYLKKAETLEQYNINIQKEIARCSILKGDIAQGSEYLIRTISLEPNNPDTQMQLALVHEMLEEEDMALMIYQKIIETNPDYIRAYIQKATLYMHIEDYINSAKVFKQILKMKPDYNRAYLALGICYEKMRNLSIAKRYYTKYVKNNPRAAHYLNIPNRINTIKESKITKKHLKVVKR